MIAVMGVPSAGVTDLWPRVAPLVERAVAEGPRDYETDDYLAACTAADMQLWLIFADADLVGAAITALHTFPRGRVVHIEIIAGDGMADWLASLDDELSRWAASLGARALTGYGRKGWQRVAPRLGYRVAGHPMRKDLAA
jgi:hypothetical protein